MIFTQDELRKFKHDAASLPPLLRIGKQGLTLGVIAEVSRQLEQRGMVKLRLLKSLTQTADRHAIATELAARTSSTLVHVVGSIVILAKKPGREHSAFAKRRVSR